MAGFLGSVINNLQGQGFGNNAQAGGGGFMNLNAQNYGGNDVMRGGGAAGYGPDGSYSGSGMSGDPSRPAPGGIQANDLAKKMYNPDGSLTGYNGLDPANNTGGGARLANQQGPQNAGAAVGQTAPMQNLGMGAMKSDWNSYFDGAKPGSSTNWGGGTLTMGADGQAKYSAQGALNGGTTINRNSIDNPASLQMLMAQAPGIAQQWKQQYGMDSGMNANDQAYWNNTLAQQGNQPGAAPTAQATAQPAQPMQNLGMSSPQSSAQGSPQMGRNPYLQQVGQAMQAQSNHNLQQNVLPGIGQGAQAAGMYGSSRQGTAEGIAMGNAQTGLNSALANMYSQGYGQDQSYDLGLRNNNLGYANLDSNNQQFGANFGLQSQNYQNQWANNSLNAANQMAQTPINQFNNFNNNASQIAGQGGSATQNNQGNPWLGFLGGAQIGSQFGGK